MNTNIDCPKTYKNCVVFLPGRGQKAEVLAEYYELKNTLIVCLTPEYLSWYPSPNGPKNQFNAIEGMKKSVIEVDQIIKNIQNDYSLNRKEIAIIGFSAGGVMALQINAHSNELFGAIVCHNGAILEPKELPTGNKTPILVIHSKDDGVFSWNERYLPMKEALIEKNYNVEFIENESNGHFISNIEDSLRFLSVAFRS